MYKCFAYSFANHEKSKKHLAEVERLREEMEEDENMINSDEDTENEEEEDGEEDGDGEAENGDEDEVTARLGQSDTDEPIEENEEVIVEKMNRLKVDSENSEAPESVENEEPDLTAFIAAKKKKNKGKSRNSQLPVSDDSDPHNAPTPSEKVVTKVDSDDEAEVSKGPKKKRRRAKKPGGGDDTQNDGKNALPADTVRQSKETEELTEGTSAKCMVCNQEFPSRSKLFKHIKTTGHAALQTAIQANAKAQAAESAKGGKKKKGRGREP